MSAAGSRPPVDGGDDVPAERSVVSQVADCFIYAPLGLAFDARDLFPDLVSKGRNQVTIMKMLGRFAMQQGSNKGRNTLVDIGTQAVSMLPGVSIAAPPDEVDDAAAEVGTERVPAPATSGEPEAAPPITADQDPSRVASNGDAAPTPSAPAAEPAAPPVDVSTLAIPDYDSLSALQVVPRLEGLTQSELEAVGQYEAATRARKTILNKVAQLHAG